MSDPAIRWNARVRPALTARSADADTADTVLDEVAQHCAHSGESPEGAIHPPEEYAAAVTGERLPPEERLRRAHHGTARHPVRTRSTTARGLPQLRTRLRPRPRRRRSLPGRHPLLDLPGWLPMTFLGIGLTTGTVQATTAALRAQRGAAAPDVLSGRLLGAPWIAAFTALFLAITGLTSALDTPEPQSVLWPAGSGLVVGLLSTSPKAPYAATRRTTPSASGSP
ncbi:hypothetical protein [Streptomyces sp. NPDC058613]|uniref:hypothetical protein n=1 Tax=unclassified Streptomyces TaxID=2593676 RepID=UPI003647066C